MRGNKSSRVTGKIIGSLITMHYNLCLELQFNKIRIKTSKQCIIDKLALQFYKFKIMIMKTGLQTRFFYFYCSKVQLIRRIEIIFYGGSFWQPESRTDHLCKSQVLCKLNAVFQFIGFDHFTKTEMTAWAAKTHIINNASHFLGLH